MAVEPIPAGVSAAGLPVPNWSNEAIELTLFVAAIGPCAKLASS